jgi:fucose permease
MSIKTATFPPSRFLTYTGYCGFVLIGWNVVLLPSLIRSLEHDFGQSDASFGLLYFIGALSYGAGTMGGGLITERVGRKVVLAAGALLAALGLSAAALAPSWIPFVLASVLVSCGAGTIDSGTNALFLDLYREARGGALNFLHLFFGVGALIAPFLIGVLITAGVSWRALLFATAAGFLVLVVLMSTAAMPSGRHVAGSVSGSDAELSRSEWSLVPFVALAFCIGLYVASEVGVSNWLVKLLSSASVETATRVLSVFWAGLSLGRLLSRWVAERFDYFTFTIGCIILSSLALAGAVVVPWLAVAAALYGLTGLFFGPIFPMIMALGGDIYPHRLAALSGGLTTSAVAGGLIYPPLMGIMAAQVGLRVGMMGAALLGIPAVASLLVARSTSYRAADEPEATLAEG